MSRPGYWKSPGQPEIAISAMAESHLRNSTRLMARRWLEFAPNILNSPGLAVEFRNKRRFYEDKLVELGTECQRRNIIPAGDITVEALANLARGWPTASDTLSNITGPYTGPMPVAEVLPSTNWVTRVRNTIAENRATARIRASPAYLPEDTVTAAASAPPRQIGLYLNVIQEVEEIMGLPVFGIESEEEPVRKIAFEL